MTGWYFSYRKWMTMDNGPFSLFGVYIYMICIPIGNGDWQSEITKGHIYIYMCVCVPVCIYSSDKKKYWKEYHCHFVKEHLKRYKIHAISLTFQYRYAYFQFWMNIQENWNIFKHRSIGAPNFIPWSSKFVFGSMLTAWWSKKQGGCQ